MAMLLAGDVTPLTCLDSLWLLRTPSVAAEHSPFAGGFYILG